MAHPFKVEKEIEVQATPEQIWEAIATGAGMNAWFLGSRNEVEPCEGGTVRFDVGDEVLEETVTAWDRPHRLAYGGAPPAPDGSVHAFEYVIEGRGGGRTLVRLVHSGFLGDDWEAEYDALNEGDFMYLHLMAQYVTHFRGRAATVIHLWRPESDGKRAVDVFKAALGVTGAPAEGEPVRFTVDGIGPIEGVLDFVSPRVFGVRTDDALYRFLYSPQGSAYMGHHIYRDDVDPQATKQAWQAWLERSFE
jgi:uncharacterized protein YndB with AHSA1/START domain